MRWILLIVAILGFALAFSTRSPGMMGIGLLIGLIGLFAAMWAFAAARIASTARPESTLLTDRDASALRAGLLKKKAEKNQASAKRP